MAIQKLVYTPTSAVASSQDRLHTMVLMVDADAFARYKKNVAAAGDNSGGSDKKKKKQLVGVGSSSSSRSSSASTTSAAAAIAQVVDSFDILTYDKPGSKAGRLVRPSKREIEEAFGTLGEYAVAQIMLEKGALHGQAAGAGMKQKNHNNKAAASSKKKNNKKMTKPQALRRSY